MAIWNGKHLKLCGWEYCQDRANKEYIQNFGKGKSQKAVTWKTEAEFMKTGSEDEKWMGLNTIYDGGL